MKGVNREEVVLRVIKGGFTPADIESTEILKGRGYRVGDLLSCDLKKARNSEQFRYAHAFAARVRDNLESFGGLSSHATLKRLQLEAGVACDEMTAELPALGVIAYRVPQSLSFATMDQGKFEETLRALEHYALEKYGIRNPD